MITTLFIALFSIVFTSQSLAKETLIFAVDIIRHGDRTPLFLMEKVPYAWKEGLGQLTIEGMKQEYALGKKLRERYVDELKLLPVDYQSEKLYVRSTDYDRTLMSAQSLLMGLYPDGPLQNNYQPIPIHSQPKEKDILISNEVDKQQFDELVEKHVYPSQAWQAKTKLTQSKWHKWSELTGWKIKNLRDVVKLGDMLFIYQLHQHPLPKELSQADIDEIIGISKWGVAALYQPKVIGEFLGKPQHKLVADYLNEASLQKNALKYVLLSAHDSTLLAIMSALGAPLPKMPPYASHLSFSLYENEHKEQTIIIKFNDEEVVVPGCTNQRCSLSQFSKLL